MQINILWSGIEYYSLENCIIDFGGGENAVKSIIIGYYHKKIYQVTYVIKLNREWETNACSVEFQYENKVRKFEFVSDNSRWTLNGAYRAEFDHCTDVDIPLTPFTNSLPINRLKLDVGQEKEIDIVYIDLLENNIRHVRQKYRKLSSGLYKYENIPNDFEAEIEVDRDGFVVQYPALFTRTARVETDRR